MLELYTTFLNSSVNEIVFLFDTMKELNAVI